MRDRGLLALGVVAGAFAVTALVMVSVLAGILGFGVRGTALPSGAIEVSQGVPVGVADTRAGAVAAADSYLALSSQSIEQNPPLFAALVAQAYAAGVRVRTLAQASQLRASDTENMTNYRQGGRGIAVVAARRLDSYTPSLATVTTWLGGFVWGPHLAPRQSWNLVKTTLRWQSGRWLVLSSSTDPTPAPVPAIVYVDGANDQSPAFARLAGMTAPVYGSGG